MAIGCGEGHCVRLGATVRPTVFVLLVKVIDLILAVCWDASLRMWLLLLLFLLPLSFSLLLLMLKTSLFLFINACESTWC